MAACRCKSWDGRGMGEAGLVRWPGLFTASLHAQDLNKKLQLSPNSQMEAVTYFQQRRAHANLMICWEQRGEPVLPEVSVRRQRVGGERRPRLTGRGIGLAKTLRGAVNDIHSDDTSCERHWRGNKGYQCCQESVSLMSYAFHFTVDCLVNSVDLVKLRKISCMRKYCSYGRHF